MARTLTFPDETWMPETLRALSVDAMRIMRNELIEKEIISKSDYEAREPEIEEIIQRLATMIERRGMDYIEIEQQKMTDE